ncbi:unnamed protein product [Staurois parvus]|uniref:Uncharacterized protein n=1 Tax=Staurois parvus TaxID=386267 RepID=A0ABN9G4M1_9NEOB|nr:unnamed protein product [Staurois parvus]
MVSAHSGDSSDHGWSMHTAGKVQNTGWRCTQRGQFRTRVGGAHSGDSSEHGLAVHTAGTVQNTGWRCTQRGQFRTQVGGAHSRDSSEHGWAVHTVGTVQNTGGQCTQQGQFRALTVSSLQTLSGRQLQIGTTSVQHSRDNQRSADSSSSPGTLNSGRLPGTRSHRQCAGSLSRTPRALSSRQPPGTHSQG